MLRQTSASTVIGLAIILSVLVLMGYGQQAFANGKQHQMNSVCPGFVILPNGHAVLSQEKADSDQSARHGKGHGAMAMKAMADKGHEHGKGHGNSAMSKHDQMKGHGHHGHKSAKAGDRAHLMGHQHGQPIVLNDNMLCVPVGSQTDTAWTAVGSSKTWLVTAVSMKGSLAHNSRANEGLKFTITPSDSAQRKVIEPSQVKVFVRMPHHNHRMVGGHGPANDPDIAGMTVQLDQNGHFTLPTIDFSMAGPWLIEVHVVDDAMTHKAYLAANVGEE